MEKNINILVRNNGMPHSEQGTESKKIVEVPMGATLEEAYQLSGLKMEHGPISARVNNKVEGMHYRIYNQKEVEFLDITSASGIRAYTRTLFFILCKAAHELFDKPDGTRCKVVIDIPISNGYYVDLQIGRPVTPDDVAELRQKMHEIINAAIPIHRHETTTEEAINMFQKEGSLSKVKLLKSTGRLFTRCLFPSGQDVRHFQGAPPLAGHHATTYHRRPERNHWQRILLAPHQGIGSSDGEENSTDSRYYSPHEEH